MKRKATKRIIAIACVIGIAGLALFSIACIHQYNLARDGLANGFDPNGQFTIRLAKKAASKTMPVRLISNATATPKKRAGRGLAIPLWK